MKRILLLVVMLVIALHGPASAEGLKRFIERQGFKMLKPADSSWKPGSIHVRKKKFFFSKSTLGDSRFVPGPNEAPTVPAGNTWDVAGDSEEETSTSVGFTPKWLTAEVEYKLNGKYSIVAKKVKVYNLDTGKYIDTYASHQLPVLRNRLSSGEKYLLLTSILGSEEIEYKFTEAQERGISAKTEVKIPIEFQNSYTWKDNYTLTYKENVPIAIGYRTEGVSVNKSNIYIGKTVIPQRVEVDQGNNSMLFPEGVNVEIKVEDIDANGYAVDLVGFLDLEVPADRLRPDPKSTTVVATALGVTNAGAPKGQRTYKFTTPISVTGNKLYKLSLSRISRDLGNGSRKDETPSLKTPDQNKVDIDTGGCKCPMSIHWSKPGYDISPN
jgi:hypothetical protein